MAKGEVCRIIPCNNIITKGRKVLICGTHRFRKKKFNNYDLPNHKGIPSFFLEKPRLPDGIVKICSKHGKLTIKNSYPKYYKGKINSYDCKYCLADNNIKRNFKGLNGIEDQEKILASQGGVCAICKGHNTVTRNGIVKRAPIDHCHKCQEPRGVLCSFCNSGLGYFKDNIEALQEAINYLKLHNEKFNHN